MSDYNILADFYDFFNGEINYAEFAEFYIKQFEKNGSDPKIILDLGCGTAKLTLLMAEKGYDMIGVDGSAEMLDKAYKNIAGNKNVLLLNQDFQSLDLYGTIDAAYSSLDALNSLPGANALFACFARVNLFMSAGGLFIFDLNSKYKFENIFANNVYYYDAENVSLIWQNRYNKAKKYCDFELTFFEKDDLDKYTRGDEIIREYCFSRSEVENILEKSGFKLLSVTDIKGKKPREDEQRLFFTAKKHKDIIKNEKLYKSDFEGRVCEGVCS